MRKSPISSFKLMPVYQLAFDLAMGIYHLSKTFPAEEKYSLTDQIRRSSRSIAANLAEGFRKYRYPKLYLSKLTEVDGETAETQAWLDFALGCKYLTEPEHKKLFQRYEELGRMIGGMIKSAALRNIN